MRQANQICWTFPGTVRLRPLFAGKEGAYGLLDWTVKASLIAGTALSTTSLAVIYAVLVEDGLNDTRIGKLLMSATFVTDMGTALALTRAQHRFRVGRADRIESREPVTCRLSARTERERHFRIDPALPNWSGRNVVV